MSTIMILSAVILTLIILPIWHIKRKLNYWRGQQIPHKRPSMIVGNFQGFRKTHSFTEILTEHYEQFKGTGPFSGFYFIHRAAVIVSDLALAKNILIKDFNNFTDRGLYNNEKDDPLTGRLFLLDGAQWKHMRSKLSPTFSSGQMKGMFPLVLQQADELVLVLNELLVKNCCIEIKDLVARFTTDVIGSCAFGIKCNSLKNPEAEFRIMGLRSLKERRHGTLISGFMQGFPALARKLHMCMIPESITNFYMKIVRELVEYRKGNNIHANDFLGILANMKNTLGIELTTAQMAAQAFVFFLGGFETSSSTLGFALYELALHQDIQDKLRREINEVYVAGGVTYEAVHNMKLMDQVISETLRKYPIIPVISRQALADYAVPGHPKYVIRKGMLVLIPIYAYHHDSNFYAEPEKFQPERFDPQRCEHKAAFHFLPFGDGPRNCIGLRFGLMQTKVALIYLLHHFHFSTCEATEIPVQFDKTSLLLSAKNGIYLKVQKVEKKS